MKQLEDAQRQKAVNDSVTDSLTTENLKKALETQRQETPTIGDVSLSMRPKKGIDRLLWALQVNHPDYISRNQWGKLAGMSSSSGSFNTYLSTLRRDDLIEEDGGRFRLSPKGVAQYPPEYVPRLQLWLTVVGKKSPKLLAMFTELVEAYPDRLTKEQLGERIGMSSTSGSFNTYLSWLRGAEIVDKGVPIKASDWVMVKQL